MTNHTMELMYGLKPVHRDNPQAGESEWYYYDPRGTDNFSDMKKIDVPSENSPNPYADEIKNYLYKNDRYNYNQLYGTTPPPATQPTQTSFTGTSGYINSQSQPTGWSNLSNSNSGFGSSTVGQHIANAVNQPDVAIGQFGNSDSINMQSFDANTANRGLQALNNNNPMLSVYNLGQNLGEFVADTKLAYDYWKKMKETGNKLVKTFGSGQAADIDNYYHPLLQCELAKISPQSRNNGIALGYAKEGWDYLNKRFLQHKNHDEIIEDSRKDLYNNLYGSNLGNNNLNKSCEDLLDDRRTPNMRKLGIR